MEYSSKIYLKLITKHDNYHNACNDIIAAFIFNFKDGTKQYLNFEHNDLPIDCTFKDFKSESGDISQISIKLTIYIQGIQIPKGLKNTDNITIEIGSRTYKEIVYLYKKNDIFIHLGGHEGLGIGLFEAIASNVPVLTLDNSPNNEIIFNNVNGWLIPCKYEEMDDNKYGLIKKENYVI